MYKKEQKTIVRKYFAAVMNEIRKEEDKNKKTFLVGILKGIDMIEQALCIEANTPNALNRIELMKLQKEFGYPTQYKIL